MIEEKPEQVKIVRIQVLSEEKVVPEARIEVEGCSRLESISNRPVEIFN